MGEFKSGILALSLLIYFFTFFIIVYSAINVGYEYDLDISDISVEDPGFQAMVDPFSANGTCGGSQPLGSAFCTWTNGNDNQTCNYIPGCTWDGSSCNGIVNLIDFGGNCNEMINETLCRLINCQWTDYDTESPNSISPTEAADFSTFKETFSIMSGFSAEIGIPPPYKFIVYFFIFWLPFAAMLVSIYFALPFLH